MCLKSESDSRQEGPSRGLLCDHEPWFEALTVRVRGGARGVRQVHGARLSAPRHRLPPRLPLLRGEGGAGTVAASCQPS